MLLLFFLLRAYYNTNEVSKRPKEGNQWAAVGRRQEGRGQGGIGMVLRLGRGAGILGRESRWPRRVVRCERVGAGYGWRSMSWRAKKRGQGRILPLR